MNKDSATNKDSAQRSSFIIFDGEGRGGADDNYKLQLQVTLW